jgi:hypothetical protein
MNYREMMAERVLRLREKIPCVPNRAERIAHRVRERATRAMHTELITQDTMKKRYGNPEREYIIRNGVITFKREYIIRNGVIEFI